MRAHPSKRFILFLLTYGSRTNDWVEATLEQNSLYMAGEDYLDALRDTMNPPMPFFPRDPTHKPSMDYLDELGVKDMHAQDPTVLRAGAILSNPPLRQQIEVALLGQVDHHEIAERVGGRFNIALDEKHIERYSYYYYDISALSMEEWSELLVANNDGYDKEVSLICGPNMAMHRLGFQAVIETKTVMRKVQQELYFRFQEMAKRPSTRGNVHALGTIARTMIKVDERLSQSDIALREVIDQFKKFTMTQDDDKVADIKDVAKTGSFSGSDGEVDHG